MADNSRIIDWGLLKTFMDGMEDDNYSQNDWIWALTREPYESDVITCYNYEALSNCQFRLFFMFLWLLGDSKVFVPDYSIRYIYIPKIFIGRGYVLPIFIFPVLSTSLHI